MNNSKKQAESEELLGNLISVQNTVMKHKEDLLFLQNMHVTYLAALQLVCSKLTDINLQQSKNYQRLRRIPHRKTSKRRRRFLKSKKYFGFF